MCPPGSLCAWRCCCTTWESQIPFLWERMGRDISTGTPGGAWSWRKESLTRLRFPRRTREQVLCLVRYHDAVIEESPQRVRRWLNKLGPERFFDLLEIQRGDASAQAPAYCTRLDHLRRLEKIAGEVLAEAPCLTVRELAVGGRELLALGYQGPAIGMALRRLLDCVLEGTLPNEKTALLQYLEQIDAKKSEGKRNKSSGET